MIDEEGEASGRATEGTGRRAADLPVLGALFKT